MVEIRGKKVDVEEWWKGKREEANVENWWKGCGKEVIV